MEDKKPSTDKRDRFLKVAERRTRLILRVLRLLGNCSNRSAYEYDDEDVAKIFSAIEQQTAMTRARFEKSKGIDFKLR